MTVRTLRVAAAGSLLALMAAPTFAQQTTPARPAAPAAAQPPSGPIVAGACVYSSQAALARSKVGTYALQRLDQIAGQVNAEITGERTKLQTDDQALSAQVQANSIQQAQAEQKALELRQRAQALANLIQVRQREVDMTQAKAFDYIGQQTMPLVLEAAQTKGCTVLFDEQAVIFYATTYDITETVVGKLDAKIQEFAFEREKLDQQPQAQGVQAPAPAPAGRVGPAAPARSGAPARGGGR